ncbi:MAG: aldehyde dehydrogenase family protein [Gemmatimonadetes bacterium]|nr:aldehyde dehydrogenase family protein [Gemmatimonadota bacterium]
MVREFALPETYRNWIAGRWADAESGATFENRNPADRDDLIGRFAASGPADVDRAVVTAGGGFREWSRVPAPRRGEILKRAGDILTERKEALADGMTREMGKPLVETRGDVQEAIDTAYYAASEGRRLFGHTAPSELPDKMGFSIRRPAGVFGIVTPWNFPIAVPSWKIFPALVCGAAVVWKPAEDTPWSAVKFVEVLLEAGLPENAIQLVTGFGPEAGVPLVAHADVTGVSFTGSTAVGRQIAATCGETGKRVSLEMGGKNAQLVMDDADLDLALEGVLWGAFGTTGQRCTATSRLILQSGIHDEFVEELTSRAEKLRLGDGRKAGTDVGPLINEDARDKVEKYARIGREEGASLTTGGEVADQGELGRGWFYRPTILTGVTPGMRVAQEEIFGPVLSVLKVGDLEEGIEVMNGVRYGLSSSIYTRDVTAAFRAIERVEAGITYINGPTIGAEAHFPFGGVKDTGNGHREGGWPVYDFFTDLKTVYVDYSGRLQRAQIDT